MDLAVPSDGYSSGAPGQLLILRNPGVNPRSADSWTDHQVFQFSSANHINDVRLRDMDGDGKIDVVARSRSGTNRIIVALQGSDLDTWTTSVFQTTYNNQGPEGIHVEDLNQDGVISVQEWGDGVAKHKDVIAKFFGGATIEEIGRQFARIDANNDEKLSWDEMLAAAGITDA